MGLFSNNKKPCPICGNATPRLLPTKVEGVPICKECDKKIDLPNGVLDSMTLDDFRRYIDFYNKNISYSDTAALPPNPAKAFIHSHISFIIAST